MKSLSRWFMVLMMISTLALVGCEGDDGDNGTAGTPGASAYEIAVANGFTGTEQEWLDSLQPDGGTTPVTAAVETCLICHGDGSFADAEEAHAIDRVVSYTVVTPPTADGADLVVAFNISVNGAPYDLLTAVQRTVIFQGVDGVYTRNQYPNNTNHLESVVNGVYTFRIPDAAVYAGTDARVYFRINTPAGIEPARRASISADDAAYARLDLASNQACINCHGNFAGGLTAHHYNPFEVSNCIACHSAVNPPADLSLLFLAHGIHNAHNMPGGEFVAVAGEEAFHTTYPTYMENCSVCHAEDAQLAAVNAMPVSGPNCFSCHGSMASWDFPVGLDFHNTYDVTTDCQSCHVAAGIARATVNQFHNGLRTERSGLIWNGQDMSVAEGAKVDMQITGITRVGNDLNVTWTAAYDGAPVNPCNTTVAAGLPIFHAGGAANAATGQSASNLSFLKGFGQGDDWVNDGAATSPGQASATNLTTTNTTCAANVATTVVPLTAAEQVSSKNGRGVLALQGKAQVQLTVGTPSVIQVRSKTPTREYMVADGALPATPRRAIADTDACLKCHVGSLYQHGGNRIDNVDMCVICHNEASSEQNVRFGDGVDATEAYDGQAGQTYGFKSMLHGIHSAGVTGKLTMIYRTMGIYVWGKDEADIPNWPGTGGQIVFGSAPAGTNPLGVMRTHNFHAPTYPRSLNDCAVCHVANFAMLPDQTTAVATTINTGADFSGQLDDTLEGASAAACMSCHQSGLSFEQTALKAHAYQNGWTPATFAEGRKTIIDAAQ